MISSIQALKIYKSMHLTGLILQNFTYALVYYSVGNFPHVLRFVSAILFFFLIFGLMCRFPFLLNFEAMRQHRNFTNSFQVSMTDHNQNQYHVDAYQANIHSGKQMETFLYAFISYMMLSFFPCDSLTAHGLHAVSYELVQSLDFLET